MILPCFTPQEMEELGIGENGFYTENKDFDSSLFFDNYKEYGIIPENYSTMLREAIETYSNKPSDLNKQKLLELGWNPEFTVNINSNSINTINKLTKSKLIAEGYTISFDTIRYTDIGDIESVNKEIIRSTYDQICDLIRNNGILEKINKEYPYDLRLGTYDNTILEGEKRPIIYASINPKEDKFNNLYDIERIINNELATNGYTNHVVRLEKMDDGTYYFMLQPYRQSGYDHYTMDESTTHQYNKDHKNKENAEEGNIIISTKPLEHNIDD